MSGPSDPPVSPPAIVAALALACLFMTAAERAAADRLQVAVASNFASTLTRLAERFEQRSGHQVVVVPGSTGKHYAQIRNGAPFAAFFAADARRPERLEAEGTAAPGSRFTYAVGRLVLWSPKPGFVDAAGEVLSSGRYRHLAIANPRLAPYGEAARQALRALGLWQAHQGRLVFGENIGQTFHFVNSGNAELGLVALSQVVPPDGAVKGSYWTLPPSLYAPIEQQAVALADTKPAREFLAFVRSEDARRIIHSFGYETP